MIEPKASQNLLSKRYDNDENKKDIHESNLEYLEKCYSELFESVGYINITGIANWGTMICSDENNNVYSIERIHEMVYGLAKEKLNL